VQKGKVVGLANAGKLNVYFDKLQHRVFLVMDFILFNGLPKTKQSIEFHLYKNLNEVYEYFMNIDITDPDEVNNYANGLRKSPEEWLEDHKQSIELEKELGIFRPSSIIEAIDFYKFPSVDSTVKTIVKSYAESIGHDDLSINLLDKKLLQDCVNHAKTLKTYRKRGYMLSTLKKFVKKMRSLATCLSKEGFKIDATIHDYRLDAGGRKSPINFNYNEKQNVWALKRDEYEIMKKFNTNNKTLRTTRDMFIVQTECGGLRVNELFRINEETIQNVNNEHVFILDSAKSKKILSYTIKEDTYELMKKYKFNMHQFEHSQTYNENLRTLAKKAGLNRQILQMISDVSANILQPKVYHLHELFSSKAARKAFISILYNEGIPVDKIARITGHSADAINHYISVLENVDMKTIHSI
jgi:hypothetical protein